MAQLGNLTSAIIASKLAPSIGLVQLNLFENLVEAGQLPRARQVMGIVNKMDSDAATRYYMEGSLALAEQRPDEAISLLTKAITNKPNEATYYERIARAYTESGQPTRAIDSFRHALGCQIMQKDAERIQSYLEHTNALTAFSLCNLAYTMQNKGDLEGALINYDKVIALLPDYADAYMGRAYVRQAKGDTNGASADYRRALQLKNPK